MFDSYECELETEAAYFAQWFHMTIADCAPLEMTVDEGRGKAERKNTTAFSEYWLAATWKVVTHDYLDERDKSPNQIKVQRMHLDLVSKMYLEISYRAKPAAPGRLQVSLWVIDFDGELQDAWDCLLSEMKKTYFLTDTLTPAPASSAATVDQVTPTPAAQLTEGEKQWYDTLLACKQAYGNKEMTWQQIADRRGASGKTAKRKLQELQARRLPGLDDWPDREN